MNDQVSETEQKKEEEQKQKEKIEKENRLLETLLLDYYHCTFFLPLIGLSPDLRPEAEPYIYDERRDNEDDAQAWLYFSPTLRDILFQRKFIDKDKTPHPWPIEEWRLPTETTKSLRLRLGEVEKDVENNEKKQDKEDSEDAKKGKDAVPLHYQVAAFHSVRLYRYFNGIYILAFTLVPELLQELNREQQRLIADKKAEFTREQPKKHNKTELTEEEKEELDKKAQDWAAAEGVPLFRYNAPATAEQAVEIHGEKTQDYKQLQLEAWLRFTRLARQIYPTFAEQVKEGKIVPQCLFENGKELAIDFDKKKFLKIETKPGVLVSSILHELLKKFFAQSCHGKLVLDLKNNVRLDDDRMHVSVAYSLAKKDLSQENVKRIFTLALYVDRFSDTFSAKGMDGHAYTRAWIEQRMASRSLGIWEGNRGYFGYTDYSAAAVYPDTFFRDVIALRHIIPIYDRMLLLALFYKASLRLYDEKICKETNELIRKVDWHALRMQREEFIRFTNQYWFHQLTEQMQGKEIFRLQQQALGLREHYEIIKDELERTDEFLQADHERKLNTITLRLTLAGVLITTAALLPMFNDGWMDARGDKQSLWYWLGSHIGFSGGSAGMIGALAGALMGVGIVGGLSLVAYRLWKVLKPQPPKEN